jgi:hypothetical protein
MWPDVESFVHHMDNAPYHHVAADDAIPTDVSKTALRQSSQTPEKYAKAKPDERARHGSNLNIDDGKNIMQSIGFEEFQWSSPAVPKETKGTRTAVCTSAAGRGALCHASPTISARQPTPRTARSHAPTSCRERCGHTS